MKNEDLLALSALDIDILTCVVETELYGLEILERLNEHRPIPLEFGSLYPALGRGYNKGLLMWRWGDDSDGSGGARRKYFKATKFGKELLKTWQKYREDLIRRSSGQSVLKHSSAPIVPRPHRDTTQ